jgi:hypothetical protein
MYIICCLFLRWKLTIWRILKFLSISLLEARFPGYFLVNFISLHFSLQVPKFPFARKCPCKWKHWYIVLHELFDPEFVPKYVGSETTTGRSRSRELIAKSGETIQITRFLTRYLSPTYNNSGINICWTPQRFVIPICCEFNPNCFMNTWENSS